MILKNKTRVFFLSLFALSFVLQLVFILSETFSEFYTVRIASVLKKIFIPVSYLPFSLAESLVIIFALLFLIAFSCAVSHLIFRTFRKEFKVNYKAIFVLLIRALIVFFFLFVTTFSSSYHRQDIAESMELEIIEVNEKTLLSATEKITKALNEVSEDIKYLPDTASSSGMDFHTLSKTLKAAADKAETKYHFLCGSGSIAKPFAFSVPLTYTHIAGIYTFFTGEPCINTNYSNYSLPYTMAHEYAHQRGAGPEDEADFAAYLIAMESDNAYVKYSALAEVFVTISNELYDINPEAYYEAVSKLPKVLLNDFQLEQSSYSKYSDSALGEVASSANDAYLKLNGVESGVKSYRESVVLLVSYLNQN